MLFGVHELQKWECQREVRPGRWAAARPIWSPWGRWRHAWWVLTGRCDAVWWPEDGNPYWEAPDDSGGGT